MKLSVENVFGLEEKLLENRLDSVVLCSGGGSSSGPVIPVGKKSYLKEEAQKYRDLQEYIR